MSLRRWKDRMVARLLTRYPGLVAKWAGGRDFSAFAAGETPWTPLEKPLGECRVALVTTGGVHLKTQTPFDMENPDGDPTFREIPADAQPDALMITHDYYDHRGADEDFNIVFPHERAADLAREGVVGGTSAVHLSFMGHIDGDLVERLTGETAPAAARRLREAGADVALLTPA